MSRKPEPKSVNPLLSLLSSAWLAPKRFWLRRRLRRPVIERVWGLSFLVLPDVFNPVVFRTGRYLADYIKAMPAVDAGADGEQPTALDVGTGCGIHAIFAAERGYKVDAVDFSSEAIRCARINLALNGREDDVTLHEGDLFAPVTGRQFDLVMCSLPKFRGQPKSAFELSWRSADVIDRFAAGLPRILKPDGTALVLLTSHGDEAGMLDGLTAAGLQVNESQQGHFGVEILTIYQVTHANAAPSERESNVGQA